MSIGGAIGNWLRSAARRLIGATARQLPPRLLTRVLPADQRFDPSRPPPAVSMPDTPVRLVIAPVNSAGQGWAWARAAERLNDVGARSSAVRSLREFGFATDQLVPLGDYRWSTRWQSAQREAILGNATHVLLESAKPLFGDAVGRGAEDDLFLLREAGIRVALLFHGSDLRDPEAHRRAERHSPYADGLWKLTPALEIRARRAKRLIERSEVPVFVSTPDLLDDAPKANWLPVVVDSSRWNSDHAPLWHGGRPIVAHVPSAAIVKGTDLIDGTLRKLDAEGVIEYRRVEGIVNAEMPNAYRSADIVLDQFRLGSYGVAACEAMAAQRIVVSHVSSAVRKKVATITGQILPIFQAEADELSEVLRAIAADPTNALELAARGPDYVTSVHDGEMSSRVLASWLFSG